MAAVTQVRNDTPGRAYYLRKQAEGKSRKEALRALKRRISDAVYQRLLADARPLTTTSSSHRRHRVGSGGQREDVSESGVTGIAPHMTRLFGTVTPEPDTTLTLRPRAPPPAHRRAPKPANDPP